MAIKGGCYCGEIRYVSENLAEDQLQCHCRECQYITGGSPNAIMVVPEKGFRFTEGTPAIFVRKDLERPVTRFFLLYLRHFNWDPKPRTGRVVHH